MDDLKLVKQLVKCILNLKGVLLLLSLNFFPPLFSRDGMVFYIFFGEESSKVSVFLMLLSSFGFFFFLRACQGDLLEKCPSVIILPYYSFCVSYCMVHSG